MRWAEICKKVYEKVMGLALISGTQPLREGQTNQQTDLTWPIQEMRGHIRKYEGSTHLSPSRRRGCNFGDWTSRKWASWRPPVDNLEVDFRFCKCEFRLFVSTVWTRDAAESTNLVPAEDLWSHAGGMAGKSGKFVLFIALFSFAARTMSRMINQN